jgi:hypothetical protein
MNRRKFIAAGMLVALAGCSDTEESSGEVQEADPNTGTVETPETTERVKTTQNTVEETTQVSVGPSIEILDHGWETLREYDSDAVDDRRGVVGTIENTGDVTVMVFVNVQFYNDDTQITDHSDYASNLDPGQKWEFEVPYLDDREVTSYEVEADARED